MKGMQLESPLDTLISAADRALRSVFAPARAARPMPLPPPAIPAAPQPGSISDDLATGAGAHRTVSASPLNASNSTESAAAARADASASHANTPAAHSATSAAGPAPSETPAARRRADDLTDTEKRTAAALMRVNHAGEIAAQALYHGQALMARSTATRELLLKAAREETDHLAWCETRLRDLDSRPSLLNPLWYAGSFAIGAAAALLGDRISLGFVVETERQVEGHLDEHLARLPQGDARSRAILQTMQADEIAHGMSAKAAGGAELPSPVRALMRNTARVMTRTAYWI
jgi:3-demethoxyubiquinol 3-hydroxylase